mmetsp:Transcript_7165/g.11317  ORF Transcript_7165/g.11317 Transcript_7165/m.11317 type:complete len:91 (+) Transcript_7165:499-771(+)
MLCCSLKNINYATAGTLRLLVLSAADGGLEEFAGRGGFALVPFCVLSLLERMDGSLGNFSVEADLDDVEPLDMERGTDIGGLEKLLPEDF